MSWFLKQRNSDFIVAQSDGCSKEAFFQRGLGGEAALGMSCVGKESGLNINISFAG